MNKQKILVVEDEVDLRNVIKEILDDAGFTVVLAQNGKEGFELAKSVVPDLILCDIQMPHMNGYELLNAVKMETELVKTPFVFMTGVNTGQFDIRRGMDLGADDYLNKPFRAEDLVSAVQTRLKKKQSWQRFFDTKIEKIHTGIVLLLPNELHLLVMDILENSQSLLGDGAVSAENVQKAARMIQASGKRLSHLHENILLFAMIQLWVNDEKMITSLRQERTMSYLNVLTAVVNENSRAQDRKKLISITCVDSGIQISPAYFGKIIDEIVDNACKFSDPESAVSITSEINNDELLLKISDKGRGMTKDEIDSIGALLQYEHRPAGPQETGLGLTIAKTIAELHGGSLTILSEQHKGTTVTVRFCL